MIQPIPLSSDIHHSLHSHDAVTLRNELTRWLEAELERLQGQLAIHTDLHTMLRTQGAVQVLKLVLEPFIERPTHARPPHYSQQ